MSFRNRLSPYSNSHNRTRTRMDMRDQTDPATQAGVRNTHRDMSGNVIGGQDRYGRNFGTKGNGGMQGSKFRGLGSSTVDGSRLGNPSTPGLDKWHAMNPNADEKKPDRSAGWLNRQVNGTTKAAAAGSQQLADRQALYADMQKAGKGGITPEMEARSKALGVGGSSFRRVAGALPKAPVSPVQPAQPPLIANGGPATPKPAPPTAPATATTPIPKGTSIADLDPTKTYTRPSSTFRTKL